MLIVKYQYSAIIKKALKGNINIKIKKYNGKIFMKIIIEEIKRILADVSDYNK